MPEVQPSPHREEQKSDRKGVTILHLAGDHELPKIVSSQYFSTLIKLVDLSLDIDIHIA